jgi:hypothetical protein
MTDPRPPGQRPGFAQARAAAAQAEIVQRTQAARTVAGQSLDAQDRRTLLSMLDLPDPEQEDVPEDDTHLLAHALNDYVLAVAEAVGVPHEGTTYEVTDTVTAYLALARRKPEYPGRDLMLIWSEWQGWVVAVETEPTEPPVMLACFGSDTVPHPKAVARFVTESIGRKRRGPTMVALPASVDRRRLAERMNRRTRER